MTICFRSLERILFFFFFNAWNIYPAGIQRFLTFVQDFWMSGNLIRAVVKKIWTYLLQMRVSTLQCICNEANRPTMHVLHRWPLCTLLIWCKNYWETHAQLVRSFLEASGSLHLPWICKCMANLFGKSSSAL